MRHGLTHLTRHAVTTQCRRLAPLQLPPLRRSSTVASTRQWSTPLAKTIADAIEATGPISIAAYMRQCLTSPQGGYYTTTRPSVSSESSSASADPFGAKGDFITSPEISQVFGELVGIWFVTEWLAQGRRKSGVQFIELGPGRGTLMDDILRTISQFRDFAAAVEAVWLVEASHGLREKQHRILCGGGKDSEMKSVEKEGRWESISKYAGVPVKWVEDISLLPPVDEQTGGKKMPFIVAHEFFDALPIHAFESVAPAPKNPEAESIQLLNKDGMPLAPVGKSTTSVIRSPQWRELLVMPTSRKFTALPHENTKTKGGGSPEPDFQLTLAKASTPTSLILPERSARYKALKPRVGSRIEISPESSRYIGDIARRIGGSTRSPSTAAFANSSKGDDVSSSGAALIIDYGPLSSVPIDSFRGIQSHRVISPFAVPGAADVSADVDFTALAHEALDADPGVEVHGPVEQGGWLLQLGVKERAEQLIGRGNGKDEDGEKGKRRKEEIETGWRRLVDRGPKGMGTAYKCLAIVPESGGSRRPVGFGGQVAG